MTPWMLMGFSFPPTKPTHSSKVAPLSFKHAHFLLTQSLFFNITCHIVTPFFPFTPNYGFGKMASPLHDPGSSANSMTTSPQLFPFTFFMPPFPPLYPTLPFLPIQLNISLLL